MCFDGLMVHFIFCFYYFFQLYKLGPAQSLCVSEASDIEKEVWDYFVAWISTFPVLVYTETRLN